MPTGQRVTPLWQLVVRFAVLRPHIRRPAAAAALAAVLAAVTAAGCSSLRGTFSAAPARPPEKHHLVVAAVPGSDSAGLYIAAERGYFSKQGLNVSIVPAASTSTAIAGQLAGKYDVTFGNYVSYIRAAAIGNAKLKVLAPGAVMGPDTQMIMVPANSPITSVPQLQGKRIAVNVKQNIGTVLVDSVLTNNAILPSASNVHYVAMPFPEMITALREHKVDAAWMAEPFVTDAEETIGAQPLADTDQGVTQNLPVDGYVATQKWARNYPRTAAAFQRAIVAGQRIAAADVGAVVQAVTKYARIPTATAALLRDPTYPTQLDPVAIQRVADLMLQFNEIPHGFTVSSMTR